MLFSEFYESYLDDVFLVERIDDEKFRETANKIVFCVIQEFDKTDLNRVFLMDYELMVLIKYSEKRKANGYFTLVEDKIPTIFINAKDYKKEYDEENYKYIIKSMEDVLFHEIIHFLNYTGWKGDSHPNKVSKDEYNNAFEFNAYYHQAVKLFETKITKDNFEDICGVNAQEFYVKFIKEMLNLNYEMVRSFINDKKWKWKWFRRIYQLYFELRKKYNKDIEKELKEYFSKDNYGI